MTATTHNFDQSTDALEVAKAFAERVHGKTIIVTGVNLKGIGFTTAQAFASQSPAHLILAGRNPAKIEEAISALKSEFPDVDYRSIKLDLSTQRTVRAAAAELLSWSDVPTVDIVVNSAAVMNLPERIINEDGLEMQFATNYIGHFLFSCLIMPKLIKAAQNNPKGATRIVNVVSLSPTMAQMRWSDLNQLKINKDLPEAEQPNYTTHRAWGETNPEEKSYLPLEGYNQSKVALLLFSIALSKRLYEKYGILSVAPHPGIIDTELSRDAPEYVMEAIKGMMEKRVFTAKTLGQGSATSLVSALDPKLGLPEEKDGKENYGAFLLDCQISNLPLPSTLSSEGAERLWTMSEELVKEKFSW
ncbi:putative short-chain dehydrogenase [Annulohypoxylon maeteangense]|uniref:putative short-chain dehydrogenase n=1 Tax=Annulohypoxylon maeteangense TaxID=1927788 RepID=UPI002007BABB|nr:putative short-chain dehydrogenase [Annulohypoxylon maeteangense]KAI0881980.1 putative short-chain dehydrogenase [Annulohypoxylon maeteangense]